MLAVISTSHGDVILTTLILHTILNKQSLERDNIVFLLSNEGSRFEGFNFL